MKSPHAIRLLVALAIVAVLGGCREPTPPDTVNSYEALQERYVESYDPEVGPLSTWIYNADDTLEDYSVYTYADGHNTEVLAYSSDTVTDDTTLVSQLLYTYDSAGNNTHGEAWEKVDGTLTMTGSYDATYNAAGYYTDYVEYDVDGNVVVHRTCTYDSTGENYLIERYYADAGTVDLIQEYVCTYDSEDATKWIRENYYLKITPPEVEGTNDTTPYESTMIFTYDWSGAHMVKQTDYDADLNLLMAIRYTFEGDRVATRASLDAAGELDLYRTYAYDEQGRLEDLRFYNYNSPAGEEIEVRETYRYYVADDTSMYEATMYTYDYAAKALSRSLAGSATGDFRGPQSAHHRED